MCVCASYVYVHRMYLCVLCVYVCVFVPVWCGFVCYVKYVRLLEINERQKREREIKKWLWRVVCVSPSSLIYIYIPAAG